MTDLLTDLEALTALVRPRILKIWIDVEYEIIEWLASGQMLPNSFHDETDAELNHAVLVYTMECLRLTDYFPGTTEDVFIKASIERHGFEPTMKALSDGITLYHADSIESLDV